MDSFNENYRQKTKQLALMIIKLYPKLKTREELRIIGLQLLRSSTSVAANFRATCVARSDAEHFSKLSIVIEECDETLLRLELLEAIGFSEKDTITECKKETLSILKVMSKSRKTIRSKRTMTK